MAVDSQRRIELNAGYVYLLSCPESFGSIKIGTTSREVGHYRYEPFGTVEPIPCTVEFSVHVPDRHEVVKNFVQRFANSRLAQDASRFAISPEDAVSVLVQIVGYEYTNAQITGIIFRKQVEMLKKMETDFRNRHKSFTILNGELGDLQKQLRGYQREIGDKNANLERQHEQIQQLHSENDALQRNWRRARLFIVAVAAMVAAAVAVAYVAAATAWPV